MNRTKPLIFFQIDSAHSVESSFFADKDFQEAYFADKNIPESNLYFITKAQKILFDINSIIIENKTLKTNILVGKRNQTYPVTIQGLSITEIIDSETHSKTISAKNSNGEILCIKPNYFVTMQNLDLKNYPEIIYIGQSFKMQERIKNHEKIIQAFSSLRDNEDIQFHFINLSFAFPDIEKNALLHFDKATLKKIDLFGFKYNDLINLSERILINFFLPKLNVQHISTDIENDIILCKIISDYNIDKIICSYELEGFSYQYNSQRQRLKDKVFNLDCSKKPYEYKPGI